MYIGGEKFKVYKSKNHCDTFWGTLIQFVVVMTILFFGMGAIAAIFNLLT